jgi:lysophospholipase L1-like esterase
MLGVGRVCAVLLSVTVAVGMLTASAAARRPAPHPFPVVAGSQYLALGDSVTFGYMEPQVTPAPNYHDPAAFPGYPEQLGALLHLRVANAACPGETSASLINVHGPSLACENTPQHSDVHYRFNFPLHVSYTGSQLAYAVAYLHHHHDVRLVSLMIGANDFFRCQVTTSDACARSSEQNAVATALTKNIHTILSAIRRRAHYVGQLVIVNYYALNYASRATAAQAQALDRIQDAAAKPFGVRIADGFGAFKSASAHSSGDPCTAGLLTQLGAGKCGVHPSYAGQALLAAAVEKAVRLV